jgi:hypothetical protein
MIIDHPSLEPEQFCKNFILILENKKKRANLYGMQPFKPITHVGLESFTPFVWQ